MKKISIGVLALVVIVALAVTVLLGSLDKIVKNQIEVIGSELLGVKVTVSGVHIDLTSGSGEITGLKIANPAGYKAGQAFDMKLLRLAIKLDSLGKQPLVLSELTIDSPVVNVELLESGKNNLQQLIDNAEQNTGAADAAAAEEQEGEPLLMAISKLNISGVTFSLDQPGEEEAPASGTLPTIAMTSVGGAAGSSPGQIGAVIFKKLSGEIIKQTLETKLRESFQEKTSGALKGLFGK
jgi:uncharacterized protein involved in outer membrane biogenesis